MSTYRLFKGFKLIGEYNSISEAKKNAPNGTNKTLRI